MRIGRRVWGGWTWLWLCQCTPAPSDQALAAGSGGAEQPSLRDAAVAAAADSSAGSSTRPNNVTAMSSAAPTTTTQTAAGSDAQPAANNTGAADSDAGETGADSADGGRPAHPPEDSSCLEHSGELNSQGTFPFEASTTAMLKLWLPKLPAGCKAPVVHFANGTGATCSTYQPVLERLASHGFLTVCAETTVTGTGVPGLQALEKVLELYPDVAAHKLGSLGHEAGGQGAMLTLQQAEAKWGADASYAGMAIAPSSGHGSQPPSGSWQDAYADIRAAMLMMSGTADQLVSERWVGDGYEQLSDSVEAYWYSGIEATHIPVPHDYIQELAIPWLRWKLLADNKACAYLKQLPETERWDLRAQQNAQDCR